ncbi:hypothetical protein FHX77_000101 [Bifidobacterium commune]|uniref:DUF3043 domain-containing protein n=1 Tax=Bifidobacterium commune TaxID=1505727 RepID=A0A1C4H172_9BIFI|nr:DUF3043 domain-containing protein [Bifidobacterium commune]MBB2954721.1 hypothetical protein [Bifidobacterium commune]SCC78633.1 Protein of unknown function [Bifidobacterium commune]
MTWNPLSKDSDKKTAQESVDSGARQAAAKEGKGRPTPKRKDAEQRNLHPLVPKDRNADRKAAKERMKKREDEQYEAMRNGDISRMPRVERDPAHIYARNYVDARFNLAEYFIPVFFVVMILGFIVAMKWPQLYTPIMALTYIYLIVSVIDVFVMWRKLKKKLIEKFGEQSVGKGTHMGSYAWGRALQLRRWRMPKPSSSKRGNWPK